MNGKSLVCAALAACLPVMGAAQVVPASSAEAIAMAERSGVCDPIGVSTAYFTDSGAVAAICGDAMVNTSGTAPGNLAPRSDARAVVLAENAGVCGRRGVRSAFFAVDGSIEATCEDDGALLAGRPSAARASTGAMSGMGAMTPLAVGGGLLAALALAGSGNGGTTSDTQ